MDFKLNYADLEEVARECRGNANKPGEALSRLRKYYEEMGTNFPPFQVLAEKLKEAEKNTDVIADAFMATAKTLEEYVEQGKGIAGSVR